MLGLSLVAGPIFQLLASLLPMQILLYGEISIFDVPLMWARTTPCAVIAVLDKAINHVVTMWLSMRVIMNILFVILQC